MEMGKSFTTHKKHSKLVHLIAFKVSTSGQTQIMDMMNTLKVNGKRMSDQMRSLMDKTYVVVRDYDALKKENQNLKAQVGNTQRIIEKLQSRLEKSKKAPSAYFRARSRPAKKKEKTPKSAKPAPKKVEQTEPTAPPKPIPTPIVSEKVEPLPKETNLLWCPDKEEWIHPVKCGQCKVNRWTTYTSC